MVSILNIAFMSLIGIATLGFLAWSVVAQHRQTAAQTSASGVPLPLIIELVSQDAPELGYPTRVPPQM